ncbi:Uncharacterised protein [Candidatus Tiddalikarchaeum anstoanum]|nr:Uncharacterised protein [Candidatus Tiddalikarchaeum anstoanum]
MKYETIITVNAEDAKQLYKNIKGEIDSQTGFKIELSDNKIRIIINSNDAASQRAGANTVFRIITVFDKMKTVK